MEVDCKGQVRLLGHHSIPPVRTRTYIRYLGHDNIFTTDTCPKHTHGRGHEARSPDLSCLSLNLRRLGLWQRLRLSLSYSTSLA